MFVSCLPLVGLTSISSPLDVFPTTIPAYTSVLGPMYRTPRVCRFPRANVRAFPFSIEIIDPTSRFSITPTCGRNAINRDERIPSPFVSIMNCPRYPSSPRVGISNTSRVMLSRSLICVINAFRFPSFSITAPENSAGTSITTSSNGSDFTPSISLIITSGFET